MVVCGMLTLLLAAAIGRVLLMDSLQRARAERRRRKPRPCASRRSSRKSRPRRPTTQNQAAILRLMNELQEVADGDLTVQATVSEDITARLPIPSTTRWKSCVAWWAG
jgi:twitching motility protein PilJ